jgi:hypothetical protein
MAYKWKPSKSQRKAFAIKMQSDIEYATAYNQRKAEREEKRRANSQFDYKTAGGNYIPTLLQFEYCMNHNFPNLTMEQEAAINEVMRGFSCNEKIHHDYIHIVNELIRNNNNKIRNHEKN